MANSSLELDVDIFLLLHDDQHLVLQLVKLNVGRGGCCCGAFLVFLARYRVTSVVNTLDKFSSSNLILMLISH